MFNPLDIVSMRQMLVVAVLAALSTRARAQGLDPKVISAGIAQGGAQTLTLTNTAAVIQSIEAQLNAIRPAGASPINSSNNLAVTSQTTPPAAVRQTTARAVTTKKTTKKTTAKKTTKRGVKLVEKTQKPKKPKKKNTQPKKGKRARARAKRDSGFSSVGPDGFTTIYGSTSATCTAANQDVYALSDQNQVPYLVMCGGDTLGINIFSVDNVDDFNSCFQFCDAYTGACTGWTFSQNDGDTTGRCLIKTDSPQTLTSYQPTAIPGTVVGGVMRAYYSTSPRPVTTTIQTTPATGQSRSVSPLAASVTATIPSRPSSKTSPQQQQSKPAVATTPAPPPATTPAPAPATTPADQQPPAPVQSSEQTQAPVQPTSQPAQPSNPPASVVQPSPQRSTNPAETPTKGAPAGPKCTAASPSYSPQPNLVSADDFLRDQGMLNSAISAYGPPGYTPIFLGYYTSLQPSRALTTVELDAYDPFSCSAKCDFTTGCVGFNIYFERDPGMEPTPGYSASDCGNPSAVVRIKCSLWSYAPTVGAASNYGGWAGNFAVAVSGSNAFVQNNAVNSPANGVASAVAGYVGPTPLAGGAVNVPSSQLATTFISGTFAYQRWDVASCAAACTMATVSNRLSAVAAGKPSYKPCNYFNIFSVSSGGNYMGMYCNLYTSPSVSGFASLSAGSAGGKSYTIQRSNGYSNMIQDSGQLSGGQKTTAKSTPKTTAKAPPKTTARVVKTTAKTKKIAARKKLAKTNKKMGKST